MDKPDVGPIEGAPPAELRIDPRVVRNVIAMGGAADGGKDGGRVEMANAQTFEIGDQRSGALKCHPVSKLQAIGGSWQGHINSARRGEWKTG